MFREALTRQALTRVLAAVLSALSLLVLLAGSPSAAVIADPSNDVPRIPAACLETGGVIPQEPGACFLTPFQQGRPTLVLWGDSHAWQFIPSLRAAMGNRDMNFVAFVMGACPPFQSAPVRDGRRGTKCERSNRQALAHVRSLDRGSQPLQVVVGAAWDVYRRALKRALVDDIVPLPGYQAYVLEMARKSDVRTPLLFETLGKAGVDVDVIAQTARVPGVVPPCPGGSQPYACDLLRANALPNEAENRQWLQDMMKSLSGRPGYIDVNRHICDALICHGLIDEVYTFFDDLHLSATLARQLGPFFAPSLRGLR